MKTPLLLLLSLCSSLVVVLSQVAPFVSFMGENLPNHSYVNLALVGNQPGNSVRCHTDLSTCCSNSQGIHRGEWYFPSGNGLQPSSSGDNIYEVRGAQQVSLRARNNAMSPSGIYCCDIATLAVHDDIDISVRDTVYVGLYASGGNRATYTSVTMFCKWL